MENKTLNLIEIFSSAQGEGKFIGCRQIFIRMAECNLHCAYCDTNFARADFCNVETHAGSMEFTQMKNPVEAAQIVDVVKNFCAQVPTHSVSFTGGEPLVNWEFVLDVATAIKEVCNVKIFLETNGTLTDELKKVLGVVDIISMDLKFPSTTYPETLRLHKNFLQVAQEKDLYVKAVVSNETTAEEFLTAINLVADVSPEILLVIQPVTPVGRIKAAPPRKILQFQALALNFLHDVRVIPQTHKAINIF